MIAQKKLKVQITLLEEILGTLPSSEKLLEEYIASKAPDCETAEQEVEAVREEDYEGKSMTVFPRDEEGRPYLYDYQVKGFFKDAAAALKKVDGSYCSKVKAFKKEIDGLLFVNPRKIPLILPEGGEIGNCQRPLRASTPMGERVALSSSETCPAGTTLQLEIICLTDSMMKLTKECLEYGILRGLGQWRNSGKGRFTFEILSED